MVQYFAFFNKKSIVSSKNTHLFGVGGSINRGFYVPQKVDYYDAIFSRRKRMRSFILHNQLASFLCFFCHFLPSFSEYEELLQGIRGEATGGLL